MKPRSLLSAILNLLVAALLIACATAVETGYSRSAQDWSVAQKQTPTLWLVDFAAVYIAALGLIAVSDRNRLVRLGDDLMMARREHQRQLEATVVRAEELEGVNAKLSTRAEELEAELAEAKAAPPTVAPAPTQEVSVPVSAPQPMDDATLTALRAQVEAHARQLDAVNMALSYHRSELSQLRHALRAALRAGNDTVSATFLSEDEIEAMQEAFSQAKLGPSNAEEDLMGEELDQASVVDERFMPRLVSTEDNLESEEMDLPVNEGVETAEASGNARNAFVFAGGDYDVLRARAANTGVSPEEAEELRSAGVAAEWRVRL